ncbi:hypothetical protein ACYDHR_10110 [Klebsiella aerogenes]|uniref:Preprotein translocase subunit SecB n=1 Tax=Klebsiella pneumoniae TaxID=573 RepID=A0A483LDU0_KLEPN|nr:MULTISPECIES: hypothetical protein [Klebsiella]HCI6550639.1 hypothetical protein [Klebsiella quasipneumoniae subsp. quasipneumoniae]HDS4883327.1 hypothetical protein [Klebsiella aerogenes]ADC57963.1 conserved hypothetical protein [Klebsiella variicola At-22]EIY4974373.1 hypothetical protein [Klebsiella quasipneumoniae]ELA0995275.1 hypothetical protein [Klebsiella pneumoniae]
MKITPIGSKVHKVVLTPKEQTESPKKGKKDNKNTNANLKLDNELYLNKNSSKIFRARYKIQVDIEDSVEVDVIYDFDFKSDTDVDQTLVSSMVIRSQVPTLVYPYIKAYLEQFLLISGYGNVPLPYVDFIENPIPGKATD